MQINIGLSFNDTYSQHAGVLIASILHNANKEDSYKFFVVTDFVSEENKNKIDNLKNIKDFEIQYIDVDGEIFKNLKHNPNVNIAAFYRFYLFSIKEVDKILYLDSDIIVRHDIANLFSNNIDDYCIAGVEDIVGKLLIDRYKLSSTTTYINSGVMLLNLKKLRCFDLISGLRNIPEYFIANNFGDQDLINYFFQNEILPLDLKWNLCYPYRTTYSDVKYYNEISKNPSIFHFITDAKPWIPGKNPKFKSEYFKYLSKTDWYEEFFVQYQIEENMILNEKLDNILHSLRNTH